MVIGTVLGLAWLILSPIVGILIGKAIRLADRRRPRG